MFLKNCMFNFYIKNGGFSTRMEQCSTKRWYIKSALFYFKMVIILLWVTTTKKILSLSYNKTTFIGVDRTNVWSKTVYFPNPSHDVFLVPRCRRQFSWCCSPRPMSKRIWYSFVFIYYSTSVVFLCLGKGLAWLSKSIPRTWMLLL